MTTLISYAELRRTQLEARQASPEKIRELDSWLARARRLPSRREDYLKGDASPRHELVRVGRRLVEYAEDAQDTDREESRPW
ncbi:hypothetical protein ACWCPS_33235 [Streptomyces mauvecolor]